MTGPFPILVPWRATGPDADHRAALWAYCRRRWEHLLPGHPIHTGDDGHEPYNRARSRNLAAQAAGDWEVAVFADADIAAGSAHQVHRAATLAVRHGAMVWAHRTRLQLDEATTNLVVHRGAILERVHPERRDHNTFSGVYAVARSLWDQVGGFDEAFQGWGFEDLAFMIACGTFGRLERVSGRIWHLWHPRGDEVNPHQAVNEARWRRYEAAKWDRDAVAQVRGS